MRSRQIAITVVWPSKRRAKVNVEEKAEVGADDRPSGYPPPPEYQTPFAEEIRSGDVLSLEKLKSRLRELTRTQSLVEAWCWHRSWDDLYEQLGIEGSKTTATVTLEEK
jgi:hypothetical protein